MNKNDSLLWQKRGHLEKIRLAYTWVYSRGLSLVKHGGVDCRFAGLEYKKGTYTFVRDVAVMRGFLW
jgi:hypothetical protein